jgi:predicted ATP-binding protein involved in virulence
MEKLLFQDVALKEREGYLDDNAYKVDETEYYKQLTPEQRAEKQEELSKLQQDILKTEAEKKEVVKQYKEKLKTLNTQNAELVNELSHNQIEVFEKVYFLVDEETKEMGMYTKEGVLISTRPLNEAEYQQSIFQLSKAE